MTPLSAPVVTASIRCIEPPAEMWRTRAVMAETSYLFSSLIAVVTHAGFMRVVLRTLCGLDEKTTWTLTKPHCCIFRYVRHSHPDRRLQEVLV